MNIHSYIWEVMKMLRSFAIVFVGLVSANSIAGTLCPDGSYVGGDTCSLTPGGRYVSGDNGAAQLAPNGQYVGGSKPMSLCPDGSYVSGSCQLAPNGRFVGE